MLHRNFTAIGQPRVRSDGPAKVSGRALYASDEPVSEPAYAFLLTSAIARGRIERFDLQEALAIAGVFDILTHWNVGSEATPPKQMGGKTTTTLESDRIWHDGQIIGVVVAESFEIARAAAYMVRVQYAEEAASATFGSAGVQEEVRDDEQHEDFCIGDADRAFAGAPVKIDARYGTPTQHHNPIELFTTTCAWNGDELTIWEPSQFVYGLRGNVAGQLKIPPEKIRVISKFVGGAFGCRGGATARTAWIAIAARRLGRPVKLVATRDQGFTIATYRAETRHHVQLGAGQDGRLLALRHEGWEVTSRPSSYNVSGTESTARMYACPNIRTKVNIVHADRNTPGFMRAPPDTPYMFALESAMDELAVALEMDPISLRKRNEPVCDPVSGREFSSRQLIACLDHGAARFRWQARDHRPCSMSQGDWQVGYGMAAACYPSNIAASAARVTLRPDGSAQVDLAGHDIGTGAYTLVAIVAADRLGLDPGQVTVHLGDTILPPAPLAAGSSHSAAISHAVAKACEDIRARLALAAVTTNDGALAGQDRAALRLENQALVAPDGTRERLSDAICRVMSGAIEAYAENIPDGLPPTAMSTLYEGELPILRGQNRQDVTAFAYGAQFAEVHIHALTREIRVKRLTGAYSAGTIINPLTARSQYVGGMIWGMSAALLEKTEIDERHARYMNDNLGEYLVPVNGDVCEVDVVLVPEVDERVNPLGVKGLGEIGIVGMNAAIANAVHHATGRRVRDLPIRIEDLLA